MMLCYRNFFLVFLLFKWWKVTEPSRNIHINIVCYNINHGHATLVVVRTDIITV